jgi:hypothetical protein
MSVAAVALRRNCSCPRFAPRRRINAWARAHYEISKVIDLAQSVPAGKLVVVRLLAFGCEFNMAEDRTAPRKKLLEELAVIKNDAIAQLERQGYDVRGKTPGQIRQILRRRPMKPKSRTD